MSIITLITDHGTKDFTIAAIKGSIYKELPEINIVDITHDVPKFDMMQGAFILRNAYKYFPKNTIHIIGILPNETTEISHVVVFHEHQYFIGADNGIFSLLFDTIPEKVIELNISAIEGNFVRPTRDIFVKAACHIARGGTIEVLGRKKDTILQLQTFRAITNKDSIRGYVIYIDNFGNSITNISELLFKEIGRGRPFTISFRVPGYSIREISKSYSEVPHGERLALFGASGFLEISINIGNASELLGLNINDIVLVEFT